jgi:hypothetical protein
MMMVMMMGGDDDDGDNDGGDDGDDGGDDITYISFTGISQSDPMLEALSDPKNWQMK